MDNESDQGQNQSKRWQIRSNYFRLLVLVLVDWLTDIMSFVVVPAMDFKSFIASTNDPVRMFSFASVIVGFIFNLPLLSLYVSIIRKNREDQNTKSVCSQLEVMHALFESLPEFVLSCITWARGDLNGFSIVSGIFSCLITVTIIVDSLSRQEFSVKGAAERLWDVFTRGLESALSVTVVVHNICMYIYFAYFSRDKSEVPFFYALAGINCFFLIIVCVKFLNAPFRKICTKEINDEEEGNETEFKKDNGLEMLWDNDDVWFSSSWTLTLVSTAVMLDIGIVPGVNGRSFWFVIVIGVIVLFYNLQLFPKVVSILKPAVFAFIAAFVVILWHILGGREAPITGLSFGLYVTGVLMYILLGGWWLHPKWSWKRRQWGTVESKL